MTLADVLAALLALALSGFGFAAFARLAELAAPELVSRAETRLSRRPRTTLLWGAGLLLASFVVIVSLLKSPFPLSRLAALGLLLTGLSLAAVGAVGLARELGRRLGGGLREGALVLGLSCLLPGVGWFVVFPAAFLAAFGAGALAPFHRPRPATAEAAA